MNKKYVSTILLATITATITASAGFYLYVYFSNQNEIKSNEFKNQNNQIININPEISTEIPPIIIEKVEDKINKDYTFTNDKCLKPKKKYVDETYLDVGQKVSLKDKSYIPDDLVNFDKELSKYPNLCLKEEVAQALKSLIMDAKKDGYEIIVSSAFRSYATQASILSTSIKNGNKNSSKSIAKPGYSEHQLGVAVDLTSPSISYESATGKFKDTPESEWLEEHAHEYGFIESYPEGKENITGYIYEPWHYRYVGIENAKEIIENGQTINEYLKEKREEEEERVREVGVE